MLTVWADIFFNKKGTLCLVYFESILGKSYIDTCSNETVSWYAAQQKCQELGYLLRSYTSFSFSTPCAQNGQMFWIGNHVAEKFVWGNGKHIFTFYGNAIAINLMYHRFIVTIMKTFTGN